MKPGALSTDTNISPGLLMAEVKMTRPSFKSSALSEGIRIASWKEEKRSFNVRMFCFDNISVEMSLRTIHFGFCLILNELLGKFLNDGTFVAVFVQKVKMFVKMNCKELSLKA